MIEHRFINALLRKPIDRTPVWLMRQAGRYLPEYREVRKQAGSFMNLCRNPELACKVTLQPLERFDLDAAIIFSDILTIPDAMGLELYFIEGEGPKFNKPLTPSDINNLKVIDPSKDLKYVMDAVSTTAKALDNKVPLIGFSGSPWTLACYMLEGQGGRNGHFKNIDALKNDKPQVLHTLLDHLANTVADYLNAQIEAGAQAIQIFDTWGGMLNQSDYQAFSLHYMQKIIEKVHKHYNSQPIPNIVFTKGAGDWLELIADIGCNGVGIDYMTDIAKAKQRIGNKVAIQGNLSPDVLLESKDKVETETNKILDAYNNETSCIFNLGHGIKPKTPIENVQHVIDLIQGKIA